MSKKRLRNRLENLFSNLAEDRPQTPEQALPDLGDVAVGSLPLHEKGRVSSAAAPDVLPPTAPTQEGPTTEYLPGWTWEINRDYQYLACGIEVGDALQMDPQRFIGESILSYGLHPNSLLDLQAAFTEKTLPVERVIYFENVPGARLPVRFHIVTRFEQDGEITGWSGFAQRLPAEDIPAPSAEIVKPEQSAAKPIKKQAARSGNKKPTLPSEPPKPRTAGQRGIAIEQGEIHPADQVWTETGKNSLKNNALLLENATEKTPAAIAAPFQTQGVGDLVLEIVDDTKDREWTEDDRFLVMEIATQLSLALDNAELYISVQQELSDRIRAEQTTLRRNKDLATLNQIGQQLSRLASREEVFGLLSAMISEVLDSQNHYIVACDTHKANLSYPVYCKAGQPVDMPDRPFGSGIPEFVISNRSPLLIKRTCWRGIGKIGD